MSHKQPYALLAVLSGLCIATLIMSATALRQLSSLPAPCECKPVAPCDCGDVVSCTCDHAALLELHAALEASIGELRVSVEALEDRASDGESKVLTGYKGILEKFQNIQRRLDKLEGRKPPVRRQASCGAHPPSCEGIAALGADGEPDSVTGILLCADALTVRGVHEHLAVSKFISSLLNAGEFFSRELLGRFAFLLSHGESPLPEHTVADVTPATGICTATPWYPGKQAIEWYQAERLASLKRRQERIEKRKLLLAFLFGACA